MLLLFLLWDKMSKVGDDHVQNNAYIITNQIKKMNKMVVMEQDFSMMQKTKITSEIIPGLLPNLEKEIITFTKTNAQVSYDLNQMKLEVDSINKKLIIRELPNSQIKITPSVEIQSMDDSFFDRFNENDIKKITQTAKNTAYKNVDQNKLRTEGRKQLLTNLSQIFVLAKALNYQIEDQTNTIDFSLL